MVASFQRTTVMVGLGVTVVTMTTRLILVSCLRLIWSLTGMYPTTHRKGLTPTVFTAALRKAGAMGARNNVVSAVWTDIENGAIGCVSRVALRYSEPSVGKPPPATVIVKVLGHNTQSMIACSVFGLLQMEMSALNFLPPIIGDIMPIIFFVDSNWVTSMGAIVMEDLGHLRAKKSRDPAGATVAEGCMMLEYVGILHGRTWNKNDLYERFFIRIMMLENMVPKIAKMAVEGVFCDFLTAIRQCFF